MLSGRANRRRKLPRLLQVLVHFGTGESPIGSQVLAQLRIRIALHDGVQQFPPIVGTEYVWPLAASPFTVA